MEFRTKNLENLEIWYLENKWEPCMYALIIWSLDSQNWQTQRKEYIKLS